MQLGHYMHFHCFLFGLGVELDDLFVLGWLVEHLARLGFSISNEEVFKQSMLQNERANSISISSINYPRLQKYLSLHSIIY